MSPELCAPPPERSSYTSDVWSYGCIILEIASAHEPWVEQFNDDSLLFRALQRKENAPIFARICENQSGPSHLRQLLLQCCAWSKDARPRFIGILSQLTTEQRETTSINEYADCMSVDNHISNVQSSAERNNNPPINDQKENIFTKYSRRKRYLIKYLLHLTKIIIKSENILWNNLSYISSLVS
jgi:serine/threonine protein kinase